MAHLEQHGNMPHPEVVIPPTNSNRVAGGRKAAVTRTQNKHEAVCNQLVSMGLARVEVFNNVSTLNMSKEGEKMFYELMAAK